MQAPIAGAAICSAQRLVSEPTEGAEAVVDGDEDDVGLLDEIGALVEGVAAGCV